MAISITTPATTEIKPKKDLYNSGKCFTQGRSYYVSGHVKSLAGLMEATVINDLNERHIIGSWWRDFEIVEVDGDNLND